MKKEEISDMINNIDDGFIAEAASYTEENSDKNKIVKKHRFFKTGSGMVAAIAVCVLLLGGITVYAFNHVAIKEFLFGKADDETFEEVYVPIEKEYQFGTHKLVLGGTIYDDATDIAYMSFEVYDSEGKKVLFDATNTAFLGDKIKAAMGFKTATWCCKAGDDKINLLFTYNGAISSAPDENGTYFLRVDKKREGDDIENKKLQFAIMDEETWGKANAEVNEIDVSDLHQIDKDYYLETGKVIWLATEDDFMPQILEILNKYGLNNFESKGLTGKEIVADKCKVIVGRTDILVMFNANDGQDITLRMEDGTEYKLVEDGQFNLCLGGKFGHASSFENGDTTAFLEWGGVTKENEELTLIVDGVEYR